MGSVGESKKNKVEKDEIANVKGKKRDRDSENGEKEKGAGDQKQYYNFFRFLVV